MLLIPNSPNCVFSFWNGMHYDTQVRIIELCVSNPAVNTFAVFRDNVREKWADPHAGQSFCFLILVLRTLSRHAAMMCDIVCAWHCAIISAMMISY